MADLRWRRGLGLLVVVLMVAGACRTAPEEAQPVSPEPPGDEAPAEPAFSYARAAEPYRGVEIEILDEITELQPGFYENIVPLFEEETGIKVNWELQGHFDVISVGEADLFTGRGRWDAIQLHNYQFPNALEAKAIEFLDPYLNNPQLRDPSFEPANLLRIGEETTRIGDKRICFPNWMYNSVWIGRKSLIEHPDEQAAFKARYGYDLAPPETLQQMRDIGEFFTRQAGDTLAGETLTEPMYGFVQEGARTGVPYSDVWMTYVRQTGSDLFDENGTPTANRPENMAALEFWASMFEFAPPGAAEMTLIDLPVVMGEGFVASMLGFVEFFFSLDVPGESAVAGDLVYAPVPYNTDSPETRHAPVFPSCLVLNAASDNKEATYLFLQWMVSEQAQNAWLNATLDLGVGGFEPVLKSSLEHPDFQGGPRGNLNTAMGETIVNGSTTIPHREIMRVLDVMNLRFQSALLGETAQAALDSLQQDLEELCTADCLVQP